MAEKVSEQKIELQERTDDISNEQNTINEYTHTNSNRNVLSTSKLIMNENSTLFGNDISIIKPNKLGKTIALLYIKDFPVITTMCYIT